LELTALNAAERRNWSRERLFKACTTLELKQTVITITANRKQIHLIVDVGMRYRAGITIREIVAALRLPTHY
jgi:hypothetical protein